MNTRYLAIVVALLACFGLRAQNVTSSPLPIILITVDGNATIPDAYKVCGTMKILYVNDSTTNYLLNQNDPAYIHYQGRIGIEMRGSTSQNKSKKPYGFETRESDDSTNANVQLLNMPEENDWVLNPLNYDNSYLRDPLSYAMATRTGHYAPRTHYCEVFLGGNYRGIYFLTEKIKCDKNRVNVAKMETTDNTFPKLSGGYIVKADKTTGGDVPAWSTPAHDYWEDVDYIYHYPKPELITTTQGAYIESYFDSLEAVMDAGNHNPLTGYPSLIDIPSFIDYMILGELTSNVDIYQKSTFFHKERKGKLYAGPVWDFNAAYGSDPFANPGRSGYNVWQFDNGDNTGSEFWYQLFHDTIYHKMFCRRWHELTAPGAPLAYDSVIAIVDSLNNEISSLVSRDKQRWNYYFNQTSAVNSLKTWLQNRYSWMNSQLTDTALVLPDLPQLAFTKIHYHPHRYGTLSADEQEFIGITNLADSTVSLAGLYLSELGISYRFDDSAVIDSAQEIYLAADTAAFRTRYGVEAMGQFARSLNNHSQRLVLADAWGRVIDDVTYSDDGYWPGEADGDGPFLTLLDPYSDNSVAQNWSTDTILLPLPECVAPINLAVNAVEYQSAQLSWQADSLHTQWVVALIDDMDHLVSYMATSNSYTLTGLMSGQTYRVSIRGVCSPNRFSEWSDTLTFTTVVCPVPGEVSVMVMADSVRVSWLEVAGAAKYLVAYGTEGVNPYQGTTRKTTDTHLTLRNLAPDRYDLYVLTMCDSAHYSLWSEKVSFEVLPAPERIDPVAQGTQVTLYPNPASHKVTLALENGQGPIHVMLMDVYGRVAHRADYPSPTATIDLTPLAKGLYFVHVVTADKELVHRLIVE